MKSLWILLWVCLNVLGHTLQNLSMPLWLNTLDDCGDPFVVYQIACTMFVVMFGLCVIFLSAFKGNRFFAYLKSLTLRGWVLIVLTGIFDSLNGIFIVIASPIERTPPIIASTFPNITFIFMIVLIYVLHRFEYLPKPKIRKPDFYSHEFVFFLLTYALCVYSTIVSTNSDVASSGQIYWWIVFLVGNVFGYVYNQFQEIFFKSDNVFKTADPFTPIDDEDSHLISNLNKLDTNNVTNFLFIQVTIQCITGYVFTFVNLIPAVAMNPDQTLACQYAHTLERSFTGMGLLWNLLFSGGYFIAYIASIGTNVVSTGLTMLMGPLSTTVIIVISYNLAVLTPDKSIIDVYFFFPMILSGMLMTMFYSAWYNGTRVGQLTNIKQYFEKFVPEDAMAILDIQYDDLMTPASQPLIDPNQNSINSYDSMLH